MAALNQDVPGFAGVWYDSSGQLTIGLVDLTQQERARSVVAAFMNGRAAARIRAADPSQFKFVKVSHSFAELKSVYDKVADQMLQRADVFGMDIDEQHNTITASVASSINAAPVADALRRAGVPTDQLRVVVEPAIVTTQTLDDNDEPLRGGLI
jgi:hypothetical protein